MIGHQRDARREACRSLPEGIHCTAFCDVTILTVSESAQIDQVLQAFVAFAAARPTPKLIWDLRAKRLSGIPAEALRGMVSRMMQAPPRGGGRSAFVIATDADEAVIRGLIAHARAGGYPVRLEAFRDDRPALEWLFGRIQAEAPPGTHEEP